MPFGGSPSDRWRSGAPALRAERLHHPVRLESLADEIAEEPLELTIVGDRLPAAEPLAQRRLDQRLVVDPLEHAVDRLLRGLLGDAGALELQADADLAALADACLHACDRLGHALIVD